MGYRNVKVFHGDGSLGLPAFAPYDRILVTAATPDIPPALYEQLAPGGIIVAPVGGKHVQQMVRLRKRADGTFEEEYFDNFVFVPLLKGKG
jgi:protein-L-isoaspartate(D-aspartate) O-methyltransferase